MPSAGHPVGGDTKAFVQQELNDIKEIAESWLYKLSTYLDAQTTITPSIPTLPAAPGVPAITLPPAPDLSGIGAYSIPEPPTWDTLPAGLGNCDFDVPELDCVTPPEIGELVIPDLPPLRHVDAPDLSFTLTDLPDITIDEFTPSVLPQVPPTPPDFILPTKPGALTLETIDLPEAPTLPPLPPLSTLDDIPDINIDDDLFAELTFDYDLPDVNLTPPDFAGLTHTVSDFDSEVMPQLRDRLLGIMQDAYVLPEDFELRQFNHAVEREREITARAVDNLAARFSARGFTLPPGQLFDAERMVRLEAELKERTLSREFWIERRKMEYQALIESLKDLVSYAQLEEDIWKTTETLLLDSKKMLVDVMYRTFALQVESAKLAYIGFEKALAEFTAKREALQANLQIQMAKFERAKLIGDRNKLMVDIDELRLKQSLRALELFDAEAKSTGLKLEQQGRLIQNHTEQYRAWATEVDAESKKYTVYSTLADIANATARVVESEARAFDSNTKAKTSQLSAVAANNAARADAVKAEADVYRTEVQSAADEMKAVAEQINAISRAYTAKASALTEATRANASGITARYSVIESLARIEGDQVKTFYQTQESKMRAYAAYVGAVGSRATVDATVLGAKADVYKSTSTAVLETARIKGQISSDYFNSQLAQWKLTASESLEYAKWARERLLMMAQYASNVAHGALTALNVQAGVSATENSSTQVSNTTTTSTSTSTRTNYNYNYS